MKIDICEYFPYCGESLNDCIERTNKFYGINKCPYNIDILRQLMEERKKISVTCEYLEDRYNQIINEL